MITVSQMVEICKANDYVIVTGLEWGSVAFNCKANLRSANLRLSFPLNETTIWYSYKPCSLNEYLNKKLPGRFVL